MRTPKALLITAVAGSVLAAAPAAHGATYTVWSCANGAGGDEPIGDWVAGLDPTQTHEAGDFCGPSGVRPHSFGAAAKVGQATAESQGPSWNLKAPEGTTIKGLDLWWIRTARTSPAPGRVEIYAGPSIFHDDTSTFGTLPPVGGSGLGDGNHEAFPNLNGPSLTLKAWCLSACNTANPNPADPNAPRVAAFVVFRSKVLVDDAKPPTGSATGLTNGARIGAPVTISASGADVGAGVRSLSLRVDGTTAQKVDGTGACADVDASNGDANEYNRIAPCPGTASAQLALTPAQLGDGAPHTVTVVATDAAGQDSVIGSARAATTPPAGFAGGPTGFVNPDLDVAGAGAANGANAGPAKATLAYAIKRGKRTRLRGSRVVSASTKALIRARLTDAANRPIAGARVWRAQAVKKNAFRIVGKPFTTSKTGRISARLPSRSPSRDVKLVYFPSSGSNANTQTPARRLVVRAATSVRLSRRSYRNRGVARFSGTISTRPLGGKREVILQARRGRTWQTFKRVRATTKGRWAGRYRFRRTSRPARYRFRAVVPSQSGYSYATGHSKTVTAVVRP